MMRRRFPKARMSVVDPFLRHQTKQITGTPVWSSFNLDRPDDGHVYLWMNITPVSCLMCHVIPAPLCSVRLPADPLYLLDHMARPSPAVHPSLPFCPWPIPVPSRSCGLLVWNVFLDVSFCVGVDILSVTFIMFLHFERSTEDILLAFGWEPNTSQMDAAE